MPPTIETERLVLVLDAPVLKTLRAVGGASEYRAKAVAGWEALDEALAMAAPSTIAVVDPYDGRPPSEGLSPRVPELIRRHPMTPVVVAMGLEDPIVEHVAEVLAWGVAEVVDLDLENTPTALVPRLRGAHARPIKRRIDSILSPYASTDAAMLLHAACEVAVDGGGAPELARRFGVETRTVAGWCRREALPPPRRLLAWTRVLLAAVLLEEGERPVLNAARGACYANDNALRRAMRDLVGGDPSTMPRETIFARATERFNDELRELREEVRARRRNKRLSMRDL
ncbi:MAG TPA: helix-turn-helix domain-containing protein [Longimicrobium sp.]|nr:helix-turn-helix domain-containing protein [Longimicrobium sp.]